MVRDLGDVDQAVNAGHDLGKGAEVDQLDNLHGDDIANGVLREELVPRIHLRGLVAEGDLLLLRIELQNEDFDLITGLHDLTRRADVAPGQLGDMDHAVHTADVDERAVGSQGLDGAQILLADLDLAPELLNGSLTGLGIDHADGADDSAAGAVELGDLHLDGLALQRGHVAALGDTGLRSRDEDANALHIGHEAALVLFGDNALDRVLVLGSGLNVIPDLHAVQLLLAELHGALLIVDANDKNFDLIADLEDVLRLDGRICADFVIRNVTGMLRAQVYLDLGVSDCGNSAKHLISCI